MWNIWDRLPRTDKRLVLRYLRSYRHIDYIPMPDLSTITSLPKEEVSETMDQVIREISKRKALIIKGFSIKRLKPVPQLDHSILFSPGSLGISG
jgi:hypothetical protein